MPVEFPAQVSLADLIDDLGPRAIRVVHAAGDLLAPVREPVFHDELHPVELRPGDLVLAVGVAVGSPELTQIVARAAEAAAAAVVVKCGAADASVEMPPDSEVSVLVVPDLMEWGQLAQLIRTALLPAGPASESSDRSANLDNLFSLANVVAALCGGPVVLHDPHWRLMAYSGSEKDLDPVRRDTILGRRAPRNWLDLFVADGSMARLLGGEVVHVGGSRHPGLASRSAVAVRAGGELMATIWLLHDEEPDLTKVEAVLHDAAEIAALELVRHRVVTRSLSRTQEIVLVSLLEGEAATPVIADRLGVPMTARILLAGFRVSAADEIERVVSLERLTGVLRTFCDAYRLRTRRAVVDGTVYVLVQLDDAASRKTTAGLLREVHRQVTQPDHVTSAALGRDICGLHDVALARSDIDRLLQLHESGQLTGTDGFIMLEEHAVTLQLAELRHFLTRDEALVPTPIRAMLDHDRSSGGDSIETLRAYFLANGDIHETAKALGLHQNTVRYRLRRLKTQFGLDLDDPDHRFMAELQLRVLE